MGNFAQFAAQKAAPTAEKVASAAEPKPVAAPAPARAVAPKQQTAVAARPAPPAKKTAPAGKTEPQAKSTAPATQPKAAIRAPAAATTSTPTELPLPEEPLVYSPEYFDALEAERGRAWAEEKMRRVRELRAAREIGPAAYTTGRPSTFTSALEAFTDIASGRSRAMETGVTPATRTETTGAAERSVTPSLPPERPSRGLGAESRLTHPMLRGVVRQMRGDHDATATLKPSKVVTPSADALQDVTKFRQQAEALGKQYKAARSTINTLGKALAGAESRSDWAAQQEREAIAKRMRAAQQDVTDALAGLREYGVDEREAAETFK